MNSAYMNNAKKMIWLLLLLCILEPAYGLKLPGVGKANTEKTSDIIEDKIKELKGLISSYKTKAFGAVDTFYNEYYKLSEIFTSDYDKARFKNIQEIMDSAVVELNSRYYAKIEHKFRMTYQDIHKEMYGEKNVSFDKICGGLKAEIDTQFNELQKKYEVHIRSRYKTSK